MAVLAQSVFTFGFLHIQLIFLSICNKTGLYLKENYQKVCWFNLISFLVWNTSLLVIQSNSYRTKFDQANDFLTSFPAGCILIQPTSSSDCRLIYILVCFIRRSFKFISNEYWIMNSDTLQLFLEQNNVLFVTSASANSFLNQHYFTMSIICLIKATECSLPFIILLN